MSKTFSRQGIRNRWQHMMGRCYDQTRKDYKSYGARGITVCEDWQEFENYYHWCWKNWKPDKEIDRRDNERGYSPENCRFVTRQENARNKRNSSSVECFQESKSMAEWSDDERCVVDYQTLQMRLVRGWAPEKALTTPANQTRKGRIATNSKTLTAWGDTKTTSEWLKDDRCLIKNHRTLWLRTKKYNWPAEKAMTQPVKAGRPKKQ